MTASPLYGGAFPEKVDPDRIVVNLDGTIYLQGVKLPYSMRSEHSKRDGWRMVAGKLEARVRPEEGIDDARGDALLLCCDRIRSLIAEDINREVETSRSREADRVP